MANGSPLLLKTLREQVYGHLRDGIARGEIDAGRRLDLGKISREMGISKTPLRDALIQLETEGFVSILPRRGVVVNALDLDDIRHLYEMIGALESTAVSTVFDRISPGHLETMRSLNESMVEAIGAGDFDTYYALNLAFHDVFLGLTDNTRLVETVRTYKSRLYDFPRRDHFVKEWELASTSEHAAFVDRLERGHATAAADFMRDVHWSFAVQERFVREYYFAWHNGGGDDERG